MFLSNFDEYSIEEREKVNCMECGIRFLKPNLQKHMKKFHPGGQRLDWDYITQNLLSSIFTCLIFFD